PKKGASPRGPPLSTSLWELLGLDELGLGLLYVLFDLGCRFFFSDLLTLEGLEHRIGHLRRQKPNRPDRVVVARDHVVDLVRIAVRIDDGDDRNTELSRLCYRDLFLARVDDKDRVRQSPERTDAAQEPLQALLLFLQLDAFPLGKQLEGTVGLHGLELLEPIDAAADRLEVRQHASEPTLVDVGHAAPFRFLPDGLLRLLLGTDEQNRAAFRDRIPHELVRLVYLAYGLLQIDDINAVTLSKDIRGHLGVPTPGLVTEVDPG